MTTPHLLWSITDVVITVVFRSKSDLVTCAKPEMVFIFSTAPLKQLMSNISKMLTDRYDVAFIGGRIENHPRGFDMHDY